MSPELSSPLPDGVPVGASPSAPAGARRTLSFRPGAYLLGRALRRRTLPEIANVATESWQIAPACGMEIRPGKALPGQLERIEGTEFAPLAEVVSFLRGGFESLQRATMGYAVRNAVLHDGVLHAAGGVRHLRRRSGFAPAVRAHCEDARAALYESWLGNRWFGNWLSDDCLTYRLAEAVGAPFTTDRPTGHKSGYERRLDMLPTRRAGPVLFRELIVFDDASHNEGQRARAEDMRRRLAGDPADRHPGVFLLRGRTGDARVLVNERQLAEHLAHRRGFRVLDPSGASVDEIVQACGAAKVVAGVEGSHLVHGLVAMPPDACAFVIQPPTRAVSALKLLTDRQGQDYAFVVGKGDTGGFSADPAEVERTLDLV